MFELLTFPKIKIFDFWLPGRGGMHGLLTSLLKKNLTFSDTPLRQGWILQRKDLALPWVGFSAYPSTTRAPVRAQLWVHALRGVYSELRAGGGTRNGRLRRKSYLGQRKTFLFPRQVGVVWRQRRGSAFCFLLLRLLQGRVWEINDPLHVQCWILSLGK